MQMNYQDINSKTIDLWCKNGWQWGKAISHEEYQNALNREWDVLLTPTRTVPHDWFGDLKGKKILGLASGDGQQIPIFSALGAKCTVLDYSGEQCEREREIAEREGYEVEIIQFDMTKKLPFNPLNDPLQYEESIKNDWGIQFSHTLEEQLGGQLEAGFVLTNLYEDTNGEGKLHEYNIPSFLATRAVKT